MAAGSGRLRALRRRIGVVFQDPYASLDPRLRVRDLIAEPLRIHGLGDPASRRAKARPAPPPGSANPGRRERTARR